ncbi:MAG: histidine phosphatase family protein [Ruminococcus sp.]|jgi:alpha-ribazole phosphatase
MKIILMRHGEIAKPDHVKRFIGQSDYPMTERGKADVRKKLKRLKEKYPTVSKICCSDLQRCIQTAKIAAEIYGKNFKADAFLREISLGSWEGQIMDEVRKNFPWAYEMRGRDPGKFCPPGGENFQEAADRALKALKRQTNGQKDNAPLLVITHAGIIRALRCREEKKSLQHVFEYRVEYGDYLVTEHLLEF